MVRLSLGCEKPWVGGRWAIFPVLSNCLHDFMGWYILATRMSLVIASTHCRHCCDDCTTWSHIPRKGVYSSTILMLLKWLMAKSKMYIVFAHAISSKINKTHCNNRTINMTCSLSFWLQMSEPITHIDTDNYMTIHHKGTGYFDSTEHPFIPLKEMISYHSLWLLLTCICHSGCRWVNQLHTWTHIITLYISSNLINHFISLNE